MKLVALTLLRSCPIHKETEVMMDQCYGHEHIGKDSECRDSGQESENEAQPAKEFCSNRQKREQRWNVHGAGEKAHRAGEAVSAKPAQHFLRPMRAKDHAEHQSKNSGRSVVIGGN